MAEELKVIIGIDVVKWVPLREGAVDWPAARQALADVGYRGSATTELPGGDAAYLREASRRFDMILSGA
jgi:hexulose-6-phosphate isomerase